MYVETYETSSLEMNLSTNMFVTAVCIIFLIEIGTCIKVAEGRMGY